MSNSYGDTVAACLARISERRRTAEDAANARVRELCEKYPEYAQIDRDMRSAGVKLARVLSKKGDVNKALDAIKEENLAAQDRRARFLIDHKLGEDYIRPHYFCSRCKDTGFIGGEHCVCLTKMIGELNCRKMNESSPLSLCSFDTFDLTQFEGNDRLQMENVSGFIKDYADSFNAGSPNLLFYGGTGLGKTHLSLAAANVVLSKGYTVIYDQAQTLFDKLADERFSREGTGETEEAVYNCDLLIIDDLGAEFVNQMTQSLLYGIINTRLLTHKPMIVSTNIPLRDLDKVYHERISSRLCFEFETVPFVGKDFRQIRKTVQH